ncbi:MAG: hypothetical protein A3J66_02125 [Candidatus Magasanikbacteria bacterium RIFCSPHIGHO2_02_FULL_47_14]|uniref:3'(2'),5-bisphosphonucleoside 3'(2')-phosphohydrolase n=1 Tax=Candidatus Magasanikbacteria bacterium RIFCSPHIGHO2_02_FULL_47_14 TaxID=1798680 RepID=A0A1F6MB79_9BACT|nr:MAG: hypothetical protein A3J66_02125 [Candidatus Magasanikbacteria bacterium RIFCSPHIGHO2_02_FULL_47_14]
MVSYPHVEDIIPIARKAGEEILRYYQEKYTIWDKPDHSPVTEADLAANNIILKALAGISPFPILSEETKDDLRRQQSEAIWIVDPLDGTRDFIKKTDEFAVMIGLAVAGQPVLGVVYNPARDELHYAEKGRGSFLQVGSAKPLQISVDKSHDSSDVRLVLSRSHLKPEEIELAKQFHIQTMHSCGGTGIKMGRIAEGLYDLYLNMSSGCGEWDTCAPEVILQEAGGVVTDMFGKQFLYNQENVKRVHGVIATNGIIHDKIIEGIQGYLNKNTV